LNRGVLEGVRIVDFTWAWAGPYGTLLLSMLGAEVIKIESSKRPDHTRVRSLKAGRMDTSSPDHSTIFADLNYNKLGITLNLSRPEAIKLAKRLIAVSDVVVENFRPGVLKRLGLGYEVVKKLKPDIIMLSSSALGGFGPQRNYTGYAPTFAALGGLTHITGYADGEPKTLMGSVDLRSATATAFAILAALNHRATTGEGQYIDLSSRESVAVLIGDVLMDYAMNGRSQGRMGNDDGISAPHNCYRCQGEDKWVSIAVTTEEEWQAFRRAIGDPEWAKDEKFADGFRRWQNRAELDRHVAEWTRERTHYEVTEILQAAGVAAIPSFNGEELYTGPHLKERSCWVQIEHPVIGRRTTLGPPWNLSATPGKVYRHAPLLGQHNDLVFGELLGLSDDEIEHLRKDGVMV